LPEFFQRIATVFAGEKTYEYQILVNDNHSNDRTWEIIKKAAALDPRIVGTRMSRTFSLDIAFRSGLEFSDSDIAILMTSDLQDPAETIPALLREFEAGFDQVLVKIKSRKSVPWIRRHLASVYYKLAFRLTDGLIPESVSDFRLLSRRTYKAMANMKESQSFIRGLGAWVGFKTTTIEIDRPERFAGESKWLKMSLLSSSMFAVRGLLAYSSKPLLWVSVLGGFLSLFFFLSILIFSAVWILVGVPFAGFGSIVGFIGLGFSLILLCLGIIAQYLGLMYEEVKGRPLYIVEERTI
jgi:dolichol-phosphate mannosyltransferase